MKRIVTWVVLATMMASARAYWVVNYEVAGTTVQGGVTIPWSSEPGTDNAISMWAFTLLGLPARMSGTITPIYQWQSSTGEPIPEKLHAAVKTEVRSYFWWDGASCPIKMNIDTWRPAIVPEAGQWEARGVFVHEYDVITTGPFAGVVRGFPVTIEEVWTSTADLGAAFLRVRAYSAVDLWAIGTSTDGTWGQPPPFFSGTNCKAQGNAQVNEILEGGPKKLKAVQVWVGDGKIPEYQPPGGPATYIHRTARFDSTHFQDQSDILVKVVATDEKNKTYSARWTGKAYNKALSLWNPKVDGLLWWGGWARLPSEAAADACRHHNHGTTGPRSDYAKPSIIASLPVQTVFFIVTHGHYDEFGDCMAMAEVPEHYITAGEVRAGRPLDGLYGLRAKLSDPTDPASPRVIPKYNLVVLHACYCAYLDLLANAFDVNRTAAAFVGWDAPGLTSDVNRRWLCRVFEGLSGGSTVWNALAAASRAGPVWVYDEESESDRIGFPRIVGDRETKLTGLYGRSFRLWIDVD